MAIKSLDDWRESWDAASGSSGQKTYYLLRQYVIDSKTGVAGVLSPRTWFAASNLRNVQYLSAEPVGQVLKQVMFEHDQQVLFEHDQQVLFEHDIGFFLWHVKKNASEFYATKFPDISDICEGDELLHVLQVIKEKTGVDYFEINVELESSSSAHV